VLNGNDETRCTPPPDTFLDESADADVSRKWVGEFSSYLDGVETISN
jgi:hypothetical protein